ncbi:MAG: TIGR00374 family protein [Calditrichaeota bacterium]|nr:MAG: TIGR00374 family protein [Calditrichota bacterium]
MSIRPKKKTVSFYFRFLISIFLIAYVFHKAGLGHLWETVKEAKLNYLLFSVALTPILIWASSWKWQIILRSLGIRLSAGRCFWLYVVGYFFNTVLPTNVGGDVVRAYAVGKSTDRRAEAFSSVFVERITGLSVLLLMAITAFFLALRQLWNFWLNIALILSVVGYVLILLIVLSPRFMAKMTRSIKFKAARILLEKLSKFQNATLALKAHRGTLIFSILNSFLFYLLAVLNVYLSSLAFSSSLGLAEAFIITPIVMVITMIPVSIGGIGLAEGAYYFTFARFGIPGAIGLSVALLMRAKALLAGLCGGIYYSTLGIDIKSELDHDRSRHHVELGDVKGDVRYFSGFEDVMRKKTSPLRKYQEIQIGNPQITSLIKFELLTTLFGYLPGMGGFFFRQLLFPLLFKSCGKGTVFGRSLSLQHSTKITLGKRCVIDEYCRLSAQGDHNSRIILGNEVLLGRNTVLGTRGGHIEIGDFSNIGAGCRLGTTSHITFGNHVLLAANCYIGGAQHRFDRLDVPIMRQGYVSRGGVTIEDNVWLGAGVIVLDGVTIGSGSVIGAGSVVTKSVPPNSIAVGVPAKIKGSRVAD